MTKLISLAFLSIFLTSCGGDGSSASSSASITTTTTPSQQLATTVTSLCETNCDATVPDGHPSSQLQDAINALNPNASTSIRPNNPSAQLEATIAALKAKN